MLTFASASRVAAAWLRFTVRPHKLLIARPCIHLPSCQRTLTTTETGTTTASQSSYISPRDVAAPAAPCAQPVSCPFPHHPPCPNSAAVRQALAKAVVAYYQKCTLTRLVYFGPSAPTLLLQQYFQS